MWVMGVLTGLAPQGRFAEVVATLALLGLAAQARSQTFELLPLRLEEGTLEAQAVWSRAGLNRIELRPPSGWLRIEAGTQDLVGLRLGWDAARLGPVWVHVTGGVAKGSRSPLTYRNSAGASGPVPDGAALRVRSQASLGGLLLQDAGSFRLGLGLEVRREQLEVAADPGLRSRGRQTRFWWRAVATRLFPPLGGVRPFVALEGAAPLSRFSPEGSAYLGDLDHLGLPDNAHRGIAAATHAPRFQVSLAAGLRFGPRRAPLRWRTAAPPPCGDLAPQAPGAPFLAVAEVPTPRLEAPPSHSLPETEVLVLDDADLHFALNRWELPEEGLARVREAARRIQAADPQPRLRITGHSDSTGSRAHNLRLSRRRAQAVARVLAAEGLRIRPADIAGQGPDAPLAPNDTEAGRARNRRVEIRLETAR